MSKDYYEILGVKKSANKTEIKKAYRKKAQQFHPDKHGGDDTKFKELNEAYDVLKDPKKKKAYDQFGNPDFTQYDGGNSSGFGFDPSGFSGFDSRGFSSGGGFEDIFGSMFGNGNAQNPFQQKSKGADIQTSIQISLLEAYNGVEKNIRIAHSSNSYPLKIPRGAKSGSQIRFKGQGEQSPSGGAAGDLLIKIFIAEDPNILRRGDDVYLSLSVPFRIAVLGGKVKAKLISSMVNLKIPSGTQCGTEIKVKGKGMPIGNTGKSGDAILKIDVTVPKNPSHNLEKALNELVDDDFI